ncbi:MAG: hemerythrin domain-containing protein [Chitinophagales bacterium]|nr:hemerythrin domain-containing protein [Chitinophagales bacterium]
MSKVPLKRHIALQAVSREHHHTLLFCWKIREGLRKEIATKRIKLYADWFWTNYLQAHFEHEEQYILPLLDEKNPLYQQTINEHNTIQDLFLTNTNDLKESLAQIDTAIVAHIRFEERKLFAFIQEHANEEDLQSLAANHHDAIIDNWEDEFWR